MRLGFIRTLCCSSSTAAPISKEEEKELFSNTIAPPDDEGGYTNFSLPIMKIDTVENTNSIWNNTVEVCIY